MAEQIETYRIASRHLKSDRNVHVWLPPGYANKPRTRYPVLYLQDGQNIFDPDTSFVRGQHWRAAETAGDLVAAGEIDPLIIVAIDNAGEDRADEYTPTRNSKMGRGGDADLYGKMLLEEL